MERRSLILRKSGLAILILVGLFFAAPADPAGGKIVPSLPLSCANAFVPNLAQGGGGLGSPRPMTLDCLGAPTGCGVDNPF
jgi:hypothetical protein